MARGEASTSAEQSEAREDDFGRSSTFRVASPLVMATRDSYVRFSPLRAASRSCLRLQPLPPASQGGSATRTNNRRPRRLLRLRCAPPSAITPKRASCEALRQPVSAPEDSLRGAPKKASESGHLKRSFSSPPVASAQTTNFFNPAPSSRVRKFSPKTKFSSGNSVPARFWSR